MNWFKTWWEKAASRFPSGAPYSHRDVSRNASADGSLQRPVPAPEDNIAPWYLGAMKEHFDNIVRGIGGAYQEKDAPLQAQESSLSVRKGVAEREFDEAKTVYDRAAEHFEKNNPGLLPDTQARHFFVYWFVSFALFVLEFPMNFAAFQIFGDSANYLTALTTLLVAGILIGSAHFLGIEWRKGPFSNGQSISVFVATLLMPGLAVVSVASLRVLHFSHQTDSEVSKISPNILFGSFVVFNLGIFLLAALLSRWAHPEGSEPVICCRKRLRVARRVLDNITHNLQGVKSEREVLHAQYATEGHRVTDQHLELVKRYLMDSVRVQNGQGVNGAQALPDFLGRVNVSPLVTLPWMLTRRPSERSTEDSGDSENEDAGVPGPGEVA